MSNIAIQVENLSKQYAIGSGQGDAQRFGYRSLRETLAHTLTVPRRRGERRLRGQPSLTPDGHTFWALKDLSFQIQQGEVVGVIGRNGAGKSTLLKILSRITEPTVGEAILYGRIASLLEVGTGFHSELTGRENIYLNGSILGMKRAEIARKFDEIVAFAEVAAFIDTPVKHYSSGMHMRLAFAVAAHLEPEILVVDEVLAVGDAAFQKKCLGKMEDAARTGRTVFLVSHNMTVVSALCQRVLYLSHGRLAMDGGTSAGIKRYMMDNETYAQMPVAERTDRLGSGQVCVTNFRWLDAQTLTPVQTLMSGQALYLEVSYTAVDIDQPSINGLDINVSFRTQLDHFVMSLNSQMANRAFEQPLPAQGQLYCYIERFPLMPGRFFGVCTVRLNGVIVDQLFPAFIIDVEDGDFFGTGITYHWQQQSVYVPHRWLNELP